MRRRFRTDRLVRILLATAMVWGFAVPIVHLACATSATDSPVLCEEHEATAHASAMMDSHEAAALIHSHHSPEAAATAGMEAPGAFVECCLFDAAALEHRASLVTFTDVPSPVVAPLDVPISDHSPAIVPTAKSDSSPPVAFRLLFSVFLI